MKVRNLFPALGFKQNQRQLKNRDIAARYDAADPLGRRRSGEYRLNRHEGPTPSLVDLETIRNRARELEQNTGIVSSILNHIQVGLVGSGIVPEPSVTTVTGDPLLELSDKLQELWYEWQETGESTGTYTELESQLLVARSYYRDGEIFIQHNPGLEAAGSRIPYTYTLLTADSLLSSIDHTDGIVRDKLGRVEEYRFGSLLNQQDVVTIPAHLISHFMYRTEIGQTRGVSALAPVINDIEALRKIDEYELVAQQVAASLALAINKGSPEEYSVANQKFGPDGEPVPRDIEFGPGSIIDSLEPGERPEILESRRPSSERMAFRDAIAKQVAGGVGPISASNMMRNYEGNYSSRRQELVEMHGIQVQHFRKLTSAVEQPKWSYLLKAVQEAGLVSIPSNVSQRSLLYPNYTPNAVPWIDPAKEIKYYVELINNGLDSREFVANSRGRDWREIQRQRQSEQELYNNGLLPIPNQQNNQQSNSPTPNEGNPSE